MLKDLISRFKRFPLKTKAIILLSLMVLIAILLPSNDTDRRSLPLDTSKFELDSDTQATIEYKTDEDSRPKFEYIIKSGDNLSSIFTRLGIPYRDMLGVMETDLNHLAIDTLQPDDVLHIWMDDQDEHLAKLEVIFNIAHKVVFTRNDDASYNFEDIAPEGDWKEFALAGEIHGSFSTSVFKEGVSSVEIDQIVRLLKDKFNFVKELRAGDKFEILQKRQYIDGVDSGNREIEAIRIFNRGRMVNAYLHSDGQYYDKAGDSLQRAFVRYPLKQRYRVSSSFDPRRRHPVTGRVTPHNGVDFATPVGTDIIASGDGVVTLTTNHPYAGKYIVISHGGTYQTRYLHLSRILVRKGQAVSRGQVIAKSGATGRITGPHLHYEFIIRNHPVDPMKAKIPMATSISKKDLPKFKARIKQIDQLFLAKQQSQDETGAEPQTASLN